jgi:hypothetical protein
MSKITMDSFGSECPSNWEEIAAYLNNIIEERGIQDDRDAIDELWEAYWHDEVKGAPAPRMEE